MRRIGRLVLLLGMVTGGALQAERLYFNDKKVPETRDDLMAIQSALQKHLEQARKATVCIQMGQGSGTGVIISEDGLVLSAAHVVTGVKKEMTVVMEDGTEYEAKSLGLNADNDAAMLQIQSDEKFPFVRYESASESGKPSTQLGDWVFALGHSGGFDKERGSVVRLGRLVRVANSTIQSDCKLIGGDSGGPLFDMHGTLIGIHSRVGKQLAENMHVPMQVFHKYWDSMESGKFLGDGPFAEKPQPGTGFMGIAVKEVSGGLEVTAVEEGYPAEEAGVKVGDIVKAINGEVVTTKESLKKIMGQLASGDKVTMSFLREGADESVEMNLVKR
ncbi:S1C family serine protease [Rubritalea tangerina]|uniref:S1C family serine protease n=2 Tax=Rubritalea tangerina TaxID=430798 RepID=A0ABW4ZB45_9BACT